MVNITKGVTINRPRETIYEFWREFSNLGHFMTHVRSVTSTTNTRSHWVVTSPAGQTVEWDAEIVEDRPNERIAWRSLEGSDIRQEGSVRFERAPADRGTEVHVSLRYDPPAGEAGATLAKLFGEEPTQQITDDLRRFKQVMETGEVVRSEGSLEGAGQGASAQRPAQAPNEEVRR
jgi:uncharacterized membrane protein